MTVLLLSLLACTEPEPPPEVAPEADAALSLPRPAVWPENGVILSPPDVDIPEGFGPVRVYVEAGHGFAGNTGNTGVRCQSEQDHTLDIAAFVEQRMGALPGFQTTLSHTAVPGPNYTRRMAAAEQWRADILLSFHSDWRGQPTKKKWPDGRECDSVDDHRGFAVLWSDEGELADRRLAIARGVAERLTASGIPPYDGSFYGDRYLHDQVAGVFTDRRGLMMLRRPAMPSIIVETHHALDLLEVERFDEPAVREAFADAVIMGIVDGWRAGGAGGLD